MAVMEACLFSGGLVAVGALGAAALAVAMAAVRAKACRVHTIVDSVSKPSILGHD
jgi:hypothetical protein